MTTALGLDVGTQGTKGLLVDVERSAVVARASVAYDLIDGLAPGAAEQHPDTWIDAVRRVCAELWRQRPERRDDLVAVGVSGQQHGLVVLDAHDRVVRPAKLWCDTETAPEARELSDRLGRNVPTGFTASKIAWLARHEPEHWSATRWVLLPHDYVNFRLTGERTMEAGDASGTGFFDPVARRFDDEATSATDPALSGKLPALIASDAPAGRLSTDGATLVGATAGVLVSAGGGDNMMSAIGAGATREGVVVASLGTSGTVFTRATRPVIDPDGLIAPFCDSTGAWLPLLCVMNLTGVTEEVKAAFGGDHGSLTEAASEVAPGCEGLLWIPYLQGERVPDLPGASGTLTGMRHGHLRAGTMYRAALEGTSLNVAWGVERMRDLGLAVDAARLVGGAAGNPLWRRILAAAIDAPVEPLEESESAALGAALQAVWCWRRDQGDDVSVDDVAHPFVRLSGEPTLPEANEVELYRELQVRFRDEVVARYRAPRS